MYWHLDAHILNAPQLKHSLLSSARTYCPICLFTVAQSLTITDKRRGCHLLQEAACSPGCTTCSGGQKEAEAMRAPRARTRGPWRGAGRKGGSWRAACSCRVASSPASSILPAQMYSLSHRRSDLSRLNFQCKAVWKMSVFCHHTSRQRLSFMSSAVPVTWQCACSKLFYGCVLSMARRA